LSKGFEEALMAVDALRGYVALVSGLTEVSRQRAVAQAKALLADGSLDPVVEAGRQAGSQVQALADDIVATGRANRDLLIGLVRSEVERAVGSLGLAGTDEVSALQAQVDRLTRRVTALDGGTASVKAAAAKKSTTKKATAKKSTAKKATAKPAVATSASGTPAAGAINTPTVGDA
jgi:polyhydroxyalkanoate synthesis regulator phasin